MHSDALGSPTHIDEEIRIHYALPENKVALINRLRRKA